MGLNSSRKHFIACCKRQATSKHHMCSDFSLFAPHFCSVIIARRNKQGWGCHALAKMNLVWFLALVPKWPFHFPHQYENIPQNSGHRNFSIDNIVLFISQESPGSSKRFVTMQLWRVKGSVSVPGCGELCPPCRRGWPSWGEVVPPVVRLPLLPPSWHAQVPSTPAVHLLVVIWWWWRYSRWLSDNACWS